MFGGGLFQEVVGLVDQWIPEKEYGHENKFQDVLGDFLRNKLRYQYQKRIPVNVRKNVHGIQVDVLVNKNIPIEMKRNLNKAQWRALDSEVGDYLNIYNSLIVVICGVEKEEVIDDLTNKYQGDQWGFTPQNLVVRVKRRKNYGKKPKKRTTPRRRIGFHVEDIL
ncbi:hypothetical protein AKJ58_00965 [candidate division MSBL1 archaeon SCGC-AAA385D11]|uniref:GxxExxY protein n=1 Tax=candidate division MSBL1 archaeon SCGC-AAA385D11 TaxID=1698286 RepID=A0A133VNN7_9EURY|nr:hypothetical protein AKJ58_00965 [candidate division MSBL1 archaeon SCGC-AAA385D11]